ASLNDTWNVPPARGSRCAARPFHFTYSRGSVSSGNTVSGDAAMSITRSMTSTSVLMASLLTLGALGRGLQPGELYVPERREVGAELLHRGAACPVDAAPPVAPERHQSRIGEDPQVLGDCRTRDVEVRCDVADRPLLVPHEPQDVPPAG